MYLHVARSVGVFEGIEPLLEGRVEVNYTEADLGTDLAALREE